MHRASMHRAILNRSSRQTRQSGADTPYPDVIEADRAEAGIRKTKRSEPDELPADEEVKGRNSRPARKSQSAFATEAYVAPTAQPPRKKAFVGASSAGMYKY